ncbi:MAG: sensor domain-containing diguanylate cyclase [Candidatus Eiseniibacteriota bacterium]
MPDRAAERTLPDVLREADDLPSLPVVAMEVLRLTRNENATLDDLARVLSRDPALSAKLLKLANSAQFSLGSPATTLQRACLVLGLKTVKLLSLGFSLVTSLRTGDAPFPYDDLWRRSLLRATAARAFGRATRSRLSDEAFVCGLLGRLGQMVLARCLPREYAKALAAAGGSWPDSGIERRLLGFDHHEIGGTLLSTWGLPPLVSLGVALQGNEGEAPADLPPSALELWGLLDAAVCCERLLAGETGAAEPLSRAADRLGLPRDRLEPLLAQLTGEIAEVAEVFAIEMAEVDAVELLRNAKTELVKTGVGVAAEMREAEERASALVMQNEALKRQAQLDPLTGLTNRAGFESLLAELVAKRRRRTMPDRLGLLLLDVDHFKKVNDTYGHPAGDEVLAMIARVVEGVSRDSDCAARIGGEELAVLMPRTSFEGLASLSERIRSAVERARVSVAGTEISVTVSLGGAAIARFERDEDAHALVELVDQCLYRAKQEGRNRCVLHPDIDLPAI